MECCLTGISRDSGERSIPRVILNDGIIRESTELNGTTQSEARDRRAAVRQTGSPPVRTWARRGAARGGMVGCTRSGGPPHSPRRVAGVGSLVVGPRRRSVRRCRLSVRAVRPFVPSAGVDREWSGPGEPNSVEEKTGGGAVVRRVWRMSRH